MFATKLYVSHFAPWGWHFYYGVVLRPVFETENRVGGENDRELNTK